MKRTSFSLLCGAALLAGCAVGESIDEDAEPGQLELDPLAGPVQGELYVEVADGSGTPLRAEAVWIAPDYEAREPADCMVEQQDGCETWHAQFEASQDVTVYARVCGLLYLEQVDLAQESRNERFAAHLTVVGDTRACEPAPSNAAPCEFEPSRVHVRVVSPQGEPLPAREVWYEFGASEPIAATCVEMVGSNCMLWETQAHGTGRYEIWANTCGKVVGLDTFTVADDPSACGPQITEVSLPGDPQICELNYGN